MRERSKNRRRKGRPAGKSGFPEDAAPLEQLDTSGEAPPVGSHPHDPVPDETAATPSVDELGHDPVTGTADLFADLPVGEDDTAPDSGPDEAAPVDADPAAQDAPDDAGNADAEVTELSGHEAVPEPDTPPEESADEAHTAIPDRPSTARKGRPSVPSWDDIMFGRRPGRD